MLLLSSVLLVAFIIHSLSSDIDDDDDGPDDGVMTPVYIPTT
jgi:hypothetical protein